MSKYGYTVLNISKTDWESAEETPISLPSNYTVTWNSNESDGFVSGIDYGIGVKFASANELKEYINANGWTKEGE